MTRLRNLLLLVISAVAAPHLGQASASTAPIPDLSGSWSHACLNCLELPLAGPGPVTNSVRLTRGLQAGVGGGPLVGDYTNPILQPWAAEAVKRSGEISLAGDGYPTPRNQCWPEQVPFVLGNRGMKILQQTDQITIVYPFDHQFRQVRLNQPHPAQVTPSWYGDSVGHFESGELVIDTVGIKVGRFSMIDWFGTPFTGALHVVERYRLLDYPATMEAIARDAKEHFQYNGITDGFDNGSPPDPNYHGKGLQIEVKIEATGAFTMPWSATVTHRRALDEPWENVCSESVDWYPGKTSSVPAANSPDF